MKRILLIGTAGVLACLCGARIALVGGGAMALNQRSPSHSALAYGKNVSPPVQSNAILQPPPPSPPSPNPVPVPPSPEQPTYYSQRITTCAGTEASANFRQYPTLDPTSVLGVVAYGDFVQLSGRTIQADGVVWYEAIAPGLYPSPDVGAQNRLEANQTGWIASCFITSDSKAQAQ